MGRPKDLKLRKIVESLIKSGASLKKIAEKTGSAYTTIHRISKELKKDKENEV